MPERTTETTVTFDGMQPAGTLAPDEHSLPSGSSQR
jgi:hypothetical protein